MRLNLYASRSAGTDLMRPGPVGAALPGAGPAEHCGLALSFRPGLVEWTEPGTNPAASRLN